jgi:hypothetical protein
VFTVQFCVYPDTQKDGISPSYVTCHGAKYSILLLTDCIQFSQCISSLIQLYPQLAIYISLFLLFQVSRCGASLLIQSMKTRVSLRLPKQNYTNTCNAIRRCKPLPHTPITSARCCCVSFVCNKYKVYGTSPTI